MAQAVTIHPAEFHARATSYLADIDNHRWQENRALLVALLTDVYRAGVAQGHRLCGSEWPVPEGKIEGCSDDNEWMTGGEWGW